jgi:hypothetical protein
MERFPVELLYVLGFIAIVLFNYIAQRAARRRREEADAQAQPAPPPVEEELLEDVWGRNPAPSPAPAPALAPRPAAVPTAAEPPAQQRRSHPLRALLQDKHELRRAVVLMMVLGPCRSQQPPER